MQYNRNKLRSLIVRTIAQCEKSDLGAVKLHKVAYYCDMMYYADVGCPMTGATYRKRPFGPTCEQLQSTLRSLENENVIKIEDCLYFGYVKKVFSLTGEEMTDYLSADEAALVDEVIDFVCKQNSAKSISELSHGKPWEAVAFGDEIAYNSVYHMFPTEVSPEAFEWANAQVDDVETTKSKSDPVDYVDFSAFREKVLAGRGVQ